MREISKTEKIRNSIVIFKNNNVNKEEITLKVADGCQ